MSRTNSPRIWAPDRDTLASLVKSAKYMSDVLRQLGLRAAGGNHKNLKRRLDAEGIDYTHIPQGRGSNKNRPVSHTSRYDDAIVFQANSSVSRNAVRNHLRQRVDTPYVCAACGQAPVWQGRALVLILDHKNGVFNDHRLENLRWMCPNCNSQLDTHCGRNNRRSTS